MGTVQDETLHNCGKILEQTGVERLMKVIQLWLCSDADTGTVWRWCGESEGGAPWSEGESEGAEAGAHGPGPCSHRTESPGEPPVSSAFHGSVLGIYCFSLSIPRVPRQASVAGVVLKMQVQTAALSCGVLPLESRIFRCVCAHACSQQYLTPAQGCQVAEG